MRTLLHDLRFGLRQLYSSPGFALISVLTLALGIASSTTVFSWVDGLLLRPYPGAVEGSRLALLEMTSATAPNGANMLSYPDYRDSRPA
jgi:hypothetical protein